jgi:1-acyl-sn-glycerol-3-phosphate acyltransferase
MVDTQPVPSEQPERALPDTSAAAEDEHDANDGKGFYWVLKNVVLGPPIKRVFRPKVEGLENVPRHGPAIIASNHLSYADWLFMPLAVPRRVTFVAKADYFVGRGLKGSFQRGFFKGTGQVPIDRSGGSASEGALLAGRKVLERGELFGIYPEGTRSHDGRLYKGRTGVARLALESKVPVIPCGVVGTDKVAPPGKVIASLASPMVRFGEPLDFSRYDGMERDRLILRAVTDEIMYRIMELSGQEYVDMYATKAKALEGRATTGAPKKVRRSAAG